jgi:CBS domain-containing protein
MDLKKSKYEKLKKWREERISTVPGSQVLMNQIHDEVMTKTAAIAIEAVEQIYGPSPSDFTWFVMGSAGRLEQASVSDQDHGIIYNSETNQSKRYFLALGKEISMGLNTLGYPYCDGKIMTSNPLWCKSIKGWQTQIESWMKEESWDAIRHLLIFYDARALVGEGDDVRQLKQQIHQQIKTNPNLLKRLMDNTRHLKKSVGVYGQLLIETHGQYTGAINLKETAFFPYVNAIRILAIKENIEATSTLSRLEQLGEIANYEIDLATIKENFKKLLTYRLEVNENQRDYHGTHYLIVKELNQDQKKELKRILREGKQLHRYIQTIID